MNQDMEIKFNDYEKEKVGEIFEKHIAKTTLNIEGIEGKLINGKRKYGLKWDLVKLYKDEKFLEGHIDMTRIGALNSILKDMICLNNDDNESLFEEVKITKEYITGIINDEYFK